MEDNIYSPDFVKGLFNNMSSSYERMNYITSFGFSIRWRTQFLDSFERTNQKVEIIDLLTGIGKTWTATKQKLPIANLTILDFLDGKLKYAKQKSKIKFNDEIIVIQEYNLKSDLPSNHFDFVTCAFGLHEQVQKLKKSSFNFCKYRFKN